MSNRLGYALRDLPPEGIKALPAMEMESQFYVIGVVKFYMVSLGNSERMPNCTCEDWSYYKLPCKHI